ncbi:MAG: hypothetical protein ABIR70_20225 [Bryobacteraceae bacterium]
MALGAMGLFYKLLSLPPRPEMSLWRIPVLLFLLVVMPLTPAIFFTFGEIKVTRRLDSLEIFTGVGKIGWTEHYRWSDFSGAHEPVAKWVQNVPLLLTGDTVVSLGYHLKPKLRRFLLQVLQVELARR